MSAKTTEKSLIHLEDGECAIAFRPGNGPKVYIAGPETTEDESVLQARRELAFVVYALNNPGFWEDFDRSSTPSVTN
jgi:hypothetical protein